MLVQPEPIRTARPRSANPTNTHQQTIEGRADIAAGAAMGRDLSQISHELTG